MSSGFGRQAYAMIVDRTYHEAVVRIIEVGHQQAQHDDPKGGGEAQHQLAEKTRRFSTCAQNLSGMIMNEVMK